MQKLCTNILNEVMHLKGTCQRFYLKQSFFLPTFTEPLSCARHCARCWVYNGEEKQELGLQVCFFISGLQKTVSIH